MNQDSIKKQSLGGIVWKLLERGGSQIVSMIVQIVLARLLLPEDYGLIGYLTVFITLSDVFLRQGFTTALIQKKDADDTDFSTVFFANIILGALIYIAFYFLAPYVALFYDEPKLTLVMRVLCSNVLIGSLSAVHEAIMAKNLEFKKSFFRGLAYTLSYGLAGITFAYLGYGVWSLVFGRLIGLAVGVVVYWTTVKWRPRFLFSFCRLKSLFSFSSHVLGTNLVNTLYNNINPLIIGKFYSSADLGYYQRGQNIPQTIMTAVDGSMTEVMYPTFSKLQSDLTLLKSALRRSMKLSMYAVFPILIGLLVIAEPLTLILLTDKWLDSVPYMQLTCVLCMFWPLSARTHVLNAIGKSKVAFLVSLVGKLISLICVIALVKYGVIYIMIGTIGASFVSFFITSFVIKKYINYSLSELLKDILPALLLASAMGIVVYLISYLNLSIIVQLIIQITVGITIYIMGSMIFRIDSFTYIVNTIKGLITNKNK